MIGLLALLLLAPANYRGTPRVPRDGRCSSRTVNCGASPAAFEFANAAGVGMGSACAGTTPTGTKGEVVTFTRASVGSCMKAGTLTGINNGDLVKLTTGQAAVMPGGNGTGPLGILVEQAATNQLIRSEQFENAAWSTNSNGVALPTITADQAVAPDGTTTADRIQVPATTGAQYSQVFNTTGFTGAGTTPTSCSFYVKSFAPVNGTLDASVSDGSARSTVACSYDQFTWSRCIVPPVVLSSTANASFIGVGSEAVNSGGGALGAAADVVIWGIQCENSPTSSSYIATAAAAVTRSAVVASVALTIGSNFTSRSFAATFTSSTTQLPVNGTDLMELKKDASNRDELAFQSNTESVYTVAGAGHPVTMAGPPANNASVAGFSDGVSIGVCTNGTCATTPGAYSLATGAVTLYMGGFESTGFEVGTVVKQVCLDSSPMRCR